MGGRATGRDAATGAGGDAHAADAGGGHRETAGAEPLVHQLEAAALLAEHPQIEWVQLPWAGIEPYVPLLDHDRTWTCAKGVYADPVAEHALALLLAGFRNLHGYARADTWSGQAGRNLLGASVTIFGGGGIAESLIGLLAPFGCAVTVVRRTPSPVAGVERVLGPDDRGSVHLATHLRGASRSKAWQAATLDELGEFHIDALVPGTYEITLQLGSDEIVLPPIDVGDVRA